ETIIMSGYGINCERETAYAFERAGAKTKVVHINDMIAEPKMLEDCRILVWPGGFSMGDDTGSGLAYAHYAKDRLRDALRRFRERNTLSIGICNGFQIMTHLGFFPVKFDDYGKARTALVFNSNARYIDRWVDIRNTGMIDKCIWTENIGRLHLPVAHGEGRFYADERTLADLKQRGQVVFTYCTADGKPANGGPANPNGSLDDIAGICDPTGRYLGMMPHPERAILSVQDDRYTRKRELARRKMGELFEETPCMQLFRNAVEHFRWG
ncbi:phosphoribosylformylglycinamidine synthase subunit PurQ, partial [Candidatus Woesearchaeota archaeon]|nr:phosphoribosylformylglycinamidine synthase subunit PurQ [Candidatus Woesearchaeota archaeon]